MITIAKFDNASEAYIVKGLLEANGIEVFIRNENIPQVVPLYGAVEIMIAEKDAEAARTVLENYNRNE